MFRRFFFLSILLSLSAIMHARSYEVKSPSGVLSLGITVDGQCCWSLSVNGSSTVKDSPLALDLGDRLLGPGARVQKVSRSSVKECIVAPFYRQASFNTAYNSLTLKMKGGWSLEARAYDDGVAYRFVTAFGSGVRVKGETACFRLAEPYRMLVPYVWRRDDGDRYRSSFENLYAEVRSGDVSAAEGRLAFCPVYVDLGNNGRLLLTEADLWDYPGMFLRTTEEGFDAEFPPYPDNTQVQNGKYLDYLTDADGSRTYPWRVVAYGQDDCDLPLNNMVYQLAAPCRLDDLSWITPGRSSWDWWSGFRLHGVPFKAGINTESYLYHIDFAAKYHLAYITVDAGWYKGNDMFKPIDGIDIDRICSYAASKGVKVILWVSKGVLGLNPDRAFGYYAKKGVAGFKIDYFDSQEAAMVHRVGLYAEAAARHHLILDLHGIYKPTGLQRTWPNVLNFEGVFGLEQNKWSDLSRTDMPRNDVTVPFVRMAAGCLDYTPGALRNAARGCFRPIDNKPMSMGTRAHQLALCVCYDAPLAMLCDSPSDYLKEDETTRWIASIPTVYDRTLIPSGKAGEWLVSAREKDGKWYVGGLASWTARDLQLDLSFLPDGKWRCSMFADGVNADTAGEDYTVSESIVDSSSKPAVHMAPGGGFVMILSRYE